MKNKKNKKIKISFNKNKVKWKNDVGKNGGKILDSVHIEERDKEDPIAESRAICYPNLETCDRTLHTKLAQERYHYQKHYVHISRSCVMVLYKNQPHTHTVRKVSADFAVFD